MTIFLDSSETRSTSTMPDIPNATVIDGLEQMTGADLMLSRLKAPAHTEALIRNHIHNKAQLVQVKRGHDLVNSIGQRLNSSLAKMHSVGAMQFQCVLLFTGIMTCDVQEQAIINKQNTGQRFFTIQAAMEGWNDRGGVVTFLPRPSLIPEWCRMRLRRLEKYHNNPLYEIWSKEYKIQEIDDLLQVLVPIEDGRTTLASLPGIGQEKANLLWDMFGNTAEALCYLTMPGSKKGAKVRGIGEKTVENIREWLGLDEVMALGLEVNETLLKRVEKKAKEAEDANKG